MTCTVKQNQTLFDIAIEHCGDAELAYQIAEINGFAITDDLPVETTLQLPNIANQKVVNYFDIDGLSPATAITDSQMLNVGGEGIEFWTIELDFIVS